MQLIASFIILTSSPLSFKNSSILFILLFEINFLYKPLIFNKIDPLEWPFPSSFSCIVILFVEISFFKFCISSFSINSLAFSSFILLKYIKIVGLI